MKQIISTMVFIIVVSQLVHSQTPYYDAVLLKQRGAGGKIILTNEVQGLLVKYYPGMDITDITVVLLEKNDFFKGFFKNKGADALADPPIDKSMKSFS